MYQYVVTRTSEAVRLQKVSATAFGTCGLRHVFNRADRPRIRAMGKRKKQWGGRKKKLSVRRRIFIAGIIRMNLHVALSPDTNQTDASQFRDMPSARHSQRTQIKRTSSRGHCCVLSIAFKRAAYLSVQTPDSYSEHPHFA
jgi:hypothetical protein